MHQPAKARKDAEGVVVDHADEDGRPGGQEEQQQGHGWAARQNGRQGEQEGRDHFAGLSDWMTQGRGASEASQ